MITKSMTRESRQEPGKYGNQSLMYRLEHSSGTGYGYGYSESDGSGTGV